MFLDEEPGDLVLLRDDGWTLLHECVSNGTLTQKIMHTLRHQINAVFEGSSPIFHARSLEAVKMLIRTFGNQLELFRNPDNQHILDYFLQKSMSLDEYVVAATLQLEWDPSRIPQTYSPMEFAREYRENWYAFTYTYPPLASACEEEKADLVEWLLQIPGIRDHETYDGLSGFAIALAKQNVRCVRAFLKSDIAEQDQNQNLFLAREIMELDSIEDTAMQEALRDFITPNTSRELKQSCSTQDAKKDYRYAGDRGEY